MLPQILSCGSFDSSHSPAALFTMASRTSSEDRFAGAMENLILLADSMQQASTLLSDEDSEEAPRDATSFLNVVALGNVVC